MEDRTLHIEIDIGVHHLTDEEIGKMIWRWQEFVSDGNLIKVFDISPSIIAGEILTKVFTVENILELKKSYAKSLEGKGATRV